MITGVDKLVLTTTDFRVKEVNSALFGIDTSTKQGGIEGELPYLLRDIRGREVKAWKIYHNSKKSIGNYTIDNRGLLIQFNPSKIIHPYQLQEINSEGYRQSINMVSSELNSIGIELDFEQLKLSRVDIAKQAEMIHPCYQYDSAFKLMKGKRMKERAYEGGYLFSNKSNQCMFYDKRAELQYHKIDAIMEGENNFMRAEVRALKGRSVASIMQVNNFKQFNTLSSLDISNCFNTYISGKIFSKLNESSQLSFSFNSEVEIMKALYENSRGGWLKYISFEGLEITLMKLGGIDAFGKLCSEGGYTRQQVHIIKNRIKSMLLEKAKVSKVREEITPATLIAELHEKFAA
jgi:hypothetical protein